MLSSHSIVSLFRTVRPCSPWGGRWIGQDIGGKHGRRFGFCATLTGRRGGRTPFVQAGAETSNTGAEAFKPDPGFSWEGHSWGVGAGVRDENAESCGVVHPLRISLVIGPLRRTYVVVVK